MSVTRYHALKHLQGFPLGANQVLENMYVDDIVFSVDENEEAIETVRQLMVLMKKGRFHLTKWVSNMKAVLADLLTEDIMGKNTMTSKTLGIVWDSANVELAYSVLSEVDPSSRDRKRQLISVTAKLYDPLEVMAKGMMINWDDKLPSDLQKGWPTWKLELFEPYTFGDHGGHQKLSTEQWDEPLMSSIAEDWSKWKREAMNLWKIKIPRCLIPFPVEETNSIELHVLEIILQ
ncbi:hypothetical protein T06_1594 [Trichinella sp. T6]|nr:hypothetical protein T06_1594 [Trichinella sp. T6]